MSPWLIIFLLLVILTIVVFALIPVARYLLGGSQLPFQPEQKQADDGQQRSDIIDMETRTVGGSTVAAQKGPAYHTQRKAQRKAGHSVRERLAALRTFRPNPTQTRVLSVTLAAVIFLALGSWMWYSWTVNQALDQFTVLVAPFDDGTGATQTGSAVAESLVDTLQASGREDMAVRTLGTAPADAAAARAVLEGQGADVLIWGTIQPGAMLDSVSLQPRLTYLPSGAYAPRAWMGYHGRFSLPHTFPIAEEAINGQAVLPPLVLALADYSQGNGDVAYDRLGTLLQTYPLHPTLPRVLRGHVLWAGGRYERAASEYQQAIARYPDDPAPLHSNLGAILLDAGDLNSAAAEFDAARQLLAGADLGSLHFNQGLLALRLGEHQEAIRLLEEARRLLPDTVPVLLALAETYSDAATQQGNQQYLAQAEESLAAARTQAPQALEGVPADVRQLWQEYQASRLAELQGRIDFLQLADARGPLAWELTIAPPLPPEQLEVIEDYFTNAVELSDTMLDEWRRLAGAAAAAREQQENPPETPVGVAADGQIERIEDIQARQHYYHSLVLIERGRTRQVQGQGPVDNFFNNTLNMNNPLNEARQILDEQVVSTPEDVRLLLADARAIYIATLYDPLQTLANERYDQVIALAPDNPMGYFGKGELARHAGDRETARQFWQQAIERNERFYPARLRLAEMAEQDGDWQTAITQMGLVAEHYPAAETDLHYAALLRRSQPPRLDEAMAVLEPHVSADYVPAMVELSQVYQQQNDVEQAISTLRAARDTDPTSAAAALELGRILAGQGDYEAAAEQFEAALRNAEDSTLVQTHLELANLYADPAALDDVALAGQHYERAFESELDDPQALLSIGSFLLEHDDPRGALSAYQRAMEAMPYNPVALHGIAQAQIALGDLSAARTNEERVIAVTDPVNPEQASLQAAALVGLGDIERQQNNLAAATDYYNQALSRDAAQVDAVLGLGQVAVWQNNWAVALGHFERAVALPAGQGDPMAHFWCGEALLRQGDLRQAATYYEEALALRPNFPAALLGLAQVYHQRGNISGALESVDRAIDLNPIYAEAYLFRGRLHEEQGNTDAAVEDYSSAIENTNQLADAFYRRGLIYLQRSRSTAAANDLSRAVTLRPDDAELFYWLGQAHFAGGNALQALNAFARAVELRDGSYAEARFFQGLAEKELERDEAAIASFEAVIATANDSDLAARARSELAEYGE